MYRILMLIALWATIPISLAQSAQSCAVISCDCSFIGVGEWRSSCEARQRTIKSTCRSTAGERILACTVAGPSAWPLAIKTRSFERVPTFLLGEEPLEAWIEDAVAQLDVLNFQLASSKDWTELTLSEGKWDQAIVSATAWRDQVRVQWWLLRNSLRGTARLDGESIDPDNVAALLRSFSVQRQEMEALRKRINNSGEKAVELANVFLLMETEQLQMAAQLRGMTDDYAGAAEVWSQAASLSEALFKRPRLTANEQRRAVLDAVAERYQAAVAYDRAGDSRAAQVAFARAQEVRANPMILRR